MLRSLIFFIFREMVLTKRKKNTIFTNERSVLWVCAEHYRIERPTACWVWGPPDRLCRLAGNHLTSSLRTPKFFVKEFSYFLMPCHQHGLRINLLVQR